MDKENFVANYFSFNGYSNNLAQCEPNFRDKHGMNCYMYAYFKWCTNDGNYGDGWDSNIFGTFQDSANSEGSNGLVCPQCGCKGNNNPRIFNILYLDFRFIRRYNHIIK